MTDLDREGRKATGSGSGLQLALIVVVALMAVVALLAIVDRVTTRRGDKVAMLGDSISAVAGRALADDLSDYDVSLRAHFGATVADMAADSAALTGERPVQVVVDLGTNDALRGVAPAETKATLSAIIGGFGDAECVHLVNINTSMKDLGQGGASMSEPAQAVNGVLDELVEADDRLRIIDWDSMVAADPGLVDDTVHPNEAGQAALADAVADSLDKCGRGWKFW
ncbi:MAG TPA: SGNH/GDSL hydrolase family protein [Microthrixaceae bacterium]|nr:SGNH/GDSL hydrolase family protein [Microthrixaceae bacterium]